LGRSDLRRIIDLSIGPKEKFPPRSTQGCLTTKNVKTGSAGSKPKHGDKRQDARGSTRRSRFSVHVAHLRDTVNVGSCWAERFMLRGAWMQPHTSTPLPLPYKVDVDLSEILIQPKVPAPVPAKPPRLRNILADLNIHTLGRWVAPLYILTSTLGVFLIANFWLDYTDSGVHFHGWLEECIQPEQRVTQSLSSSTPGSAPVLSPPPVSEPGSFPPPVSLLPSDSGGGAPSLTQLDTLPPQPKPAAASVARRSVKSKRTNKHVSHSKAVSHKPNAFLQFLGKIAGKK
jgi:hypothetical protein